MVGPAAASTTPQKTKGFDQEIHFVKMKKLKTYRFRQNSRRRCPTPSTRYHLRCTTYGSEEQGGLRVEECGPLRKMLCFPWFCGFANPALFLSSCESTAGYAVDVIYAKARNRSQEVRWDDCGDSSVRGWAGPGRELGVLSLVPVTF